MQTILITGGTGLVGKALTKALLARGYQVIVLTRDTGDKKQGDLLRYAAWDIKGQVMDTAALLDADHIVHLAGAGVVDKKWTDAYKKEIVESRTESSRLLVESLTNNPGHHVKTVVSASAIGYYGADTAPVKAFTETDTPDPGFLGQTCILWEESIEPVARLGIRVVKLRTGIVLSNEGGALAEFKKPVKFGVAGILGNGRQVVSWIHIDDLCRMFIRAIEDEDTAGVYNAVAPHPVTNKTLTLALAKAMKGNFYIPMTVPVFVLKLMMGDRSIEVLKSTTVSCKKIQDTGFQFNFENIKAALTNLVKK